MWENCQVMRSFCVKLFAFYVVLSIADGYRILGVFPHISRSHYIVGDALMKGLAAKGHEITMVSPFERTKPIQNIRDIYLENSVSDAKKGVADGKFVRYNNMNFVDTAEFLYALSVNFTKSTMSSENFKRFIYEKSQFDVVIFEVYVCDATIGLGYYFNAPIIGFSTIGHSKWTSDLTGLSDLASHVPNFHTGFTDQMNFWQRMYNSLSYWYEDIKLQWTYFPAQQKLLDKMFPNETKMPTYAQLRRNVSLVFVNSHVSYSIPQPITPNVIEVGGIHVKQTVDPLTNDIQTFLDDAKCGAIYFSMGSNIELAKLPLREKQIIANAFCEFPNVKILIKNTDDFNISSHDPSNVLVRKWFNQEAILSHPNVKVFVTHGGLLSTTEAVHFGKPVVGIPVFFDQSLNMNTAQQKGYGISVPYEHLTEERLKLAIRQILTNSSYSAAAKLISQRYHDQLNTPLEKAIHWVEHVAKNKGAHYLQSSGVHLPFIIYYNLDVWAFITSGLGIATYILLKLLQKFWFRLWLSNDFELKQKLQ